MIERILELINSWGITQAKLCKDLDLPPSTFRTWKKGAIPAADTLYKVAQYFGVTVEYLLTGDKISPAKLSDAETELLENYKSINDEKKELLLKISGYLNGKQ